MASRIFLTGFPGFIARRLTDRLLEKDPEASVLFLIEDRMHELAASSIAALDERHPGFQQRATLVSGNITAPWLGIGEDRYRQEAERTTHIWHLAAIYHLSVPPSLAYRVNVLGTAAVLDLAEACPALRRFDYVSTCFVSGDRRGRILETDLDEGQGFKNHYESTKCWAEMEVRRRMPRLPVAIHRPGIVVGDSRSGQTDKYDGPYYIMRLLSRIPTWLPMVNIGTGRALVNLVPIDFVTASMAALWAEPDSLGQTIHLADPHPHSAREVMEGILEVMGFSRPRFSLPPMLVEQALGLQRVSNLARIPRETVSYFNHEAVYDTANQERLLERTGLRCPDFLDILPVLARYVRDHPDGPHVDGRSF